MSEEVQTFRATNGRVTGVIGLVLAVVVGVAFLATAIASVAVPGALGCALGGLLVWSALLKPKVSATAEELRMRNFAEDVTIPLASIESVVVRRYLLIRSGGVKYISPAIGRSLRKTVRSEMKWQGGSSLSLSPGTKSIDLAAVANAQPAGKGIDYADFVESQILHLAATDRARRGIEARSEEEYELGSEVVRRRAWPELVALAVLAVLFVVAVIVF